MLLTNARLLINLFKKSILFFWKKANKKKEKNLQ
jgi:hypothetical protein